MPFLADSSSYATSVADVTAESLFSLNIPHIFGVSRIFLTRSLWERIHSFAH